MQLRPVVIFDFDGTIADSLAATLNVLYELVHHQALPKEDISQLRGMGLMRTLHTLRIPPWRALLVAHRARHDLASYIDEMALIPDMDMALRNLATVADLYIVSSNDVVSIREFLKRFELEQLFVDIIGDANLWHKSRVLKRLVHARHLQQHELWYVGDRAWDVQAAHQAGMKAIAVAWGYSNLHVLKRNRPEALVFTSDELEAVITKANHG